MNRAAIAGVAVATALAQGGCASVSYVDARRVRHVIGLVNLALPPAAPGSAQAAALTTLGVAIRAGGEAGTQVALGYSREVAMSVPPDACIDLNRPGPCAEMAATRPPRPSASQEKQP